MINYILPGDVPRIELVDCPLRIRHSGSSALLEYHNGDAWCCILELTCYGYLRRHEFTSSHPFLTKGCRIALEQGDPAFGK
jgi:hypothetical protein